MSIVLESAPSQLHNLEVGLRCMWSATTLCDKSRDAGDPSTNLGELETNLTERCHGLMWAIKSVISWLAGWDSLRFVLVRCATKGVYPVKSACAACSNPSYRAGGYEMSDLVAIIYPTEAKAEEVRQRGHRGDAVAERHACAHVQHVQVGAQRGDTHAVNGTPYAGEAGP